ncbi:auxin-responsive protein SAUR21-like [Camellia sinensis]|uniref:Uncharacterized protein n=1 Tax=Camellia sinensis var. sinensis TaxID=542762 RepID=A0A4S4EQB0_CAMSN|nr:auxin-responsive protein SAUR21-like [Camellia sinensis]THG18336.1 hypothetical protein TEA_014792 [Camellia sinensis var. sinensis]
MGQSRLQKNFKSSGCFVWVKYAVKQLQKGFLCLLKQETGDCNITKKIIDEANPMEGHFPVLAICNGEEARKFLVALSYLAYPPFVKLLEAAEQEFGFDQPGVLVVPCKANELQRILLRAKEMKKP